MRKERTSPLDMACENGHENTRHLLLNGANIKILNCVGCVSTSNDIVPINDKKIYHIALQLQRLVL